MAMTPRRKNVVANHPRLFTPKATALSMKLCFDLMYAWSRFDFFREFGFTLEVELHSTRPIVSLSPS